MKQGYARNWPLMAAGLVHLILLETLLNCLILILTNRLQQHSLDELMELHIKEQKKCQQNHHEKLLLIKKMNLLSIM